MNVRMHAEERMRMLRGFYRYGEEDSFPFVYHKSMQRGLRFKRYIAPDSFSFKTDYFRMGNQYGRVLFMRDFAAMLGDNVINRLTEINKNLMLSIDYVPIPVDEAIKEVKGRILIEDTNITNFQNRQMKNQNYSAQIPQEMTTARDELNDLLARLMQNNERLLFGQLTIVHTADSLQELNEDTAALKAAAGGCACQLTTLYYQQMQGLNSTLPYGERAVDYLRSMTTTAAASLIPFHVQELQHKYGIYYGQNAISKNLIVINLATLNNGNCVIVGNSGSGKSLYAKYILLQQRLLSADADIIIIDPERECARLVHALGGEVIRISADSPNHINAMDINADYDESSNPIILKSEFIMSLFEQLIDEPLNAKQKSIIDRCTAITYRYYLQGNYMGIPPTLQDLRDVLLQQPEQEAHELALQMELFAEGSLNTFAKQTNVNTQSNLICYDILDLGEQLLPIGMLVVLDSILNRISRNREKKKQTFIVIDELYLMFQHEYSANFLYKLWKRVRKYGASCTGITQNITDMTESHIAQTMLSNSEFVIMLNQAAPDREALVSLMNISSEQLSFITDVGVGRGLMKVEKALIPFENLIPKELAPNIYRLLTTRPDEV